MKNMENREHYPILLVRKTAQMKITRITGCFNWLVVKHRLTAMAKGDGHKIIMVVQYVLQLF